MLIWLSLYLFLKLLFQISFADKIVASRIITQGAGKGQEAWVETFRISYVKKDIWTWLLDSSRNPKVCINTLMIPLAVLNYCKINEIDPDVENPTTLYKTGSLS